MPSQPDDLSGDTARLSVRQGLVLVTSIAILTGCLLSARRLRSRDPKKYPCPVWQTAAISRMPPAGVASKRGPRSFARRSRGHQPPPTWAVAWALRAAWRAYCAVEDSVVVLGSARAGKGLHLAIPMILDAHGPVLTTSTRPDNLTATLRRRAARGPVAVFDPHGLAPGIPSATRWSPIRGCEELLRICDVARDMARRRRSRR